MTLPVIILFVVWFVFLAEFWFLPSLDRFGRYKKPIFLIGSLVSGLIAVGIAVNISQLRADQKSENQAKANPNPQAEVRRTSTQEKAKGTIKTTPETNPKDSGSKPVPQAPATPPLKEPPAAGRPQQVVVQPGAAASFNQQGGITVGQIINNPPQKMMFNCVLLDGQIAEGLSHMFPEFRLTQIEKKLDLFS